MFSDLPGYQPGNLAVRAAMWPDLRGEVSASDHERPLVTGVNGPLTVAVTGGTGAYQNVCGRLAVERTFPIAPPAWRRWARFLRDQVGRADGQRKRTAYTLVERATGTEPA